MSDLADLHRTVRATLASQRLGRPVFVRYFWYGPDPPEALPGRLAQILAEVQAWLNQDLDRLHANATGDRRHVALTLQFQAGATALIGFSRTPAAEAGMDLLVLGNRGALYHEEDRVVLGTHSAALSSESPDPIIQDRIARALRSGQPN
jgi:hypothetical protein